MMMKRYLMLPFLLAMFLSESVQAQQRLGYFAAAQQRTGGSAFIIEAAGGAVGSLAGFGLGYAIAADCDTEDLGCAISNAFGAIVLGTTFSAIGTIVAGNMGDTRPSVPGAIIGSVAGAAAGVGVWHLITEEINLTSSDAVAVVSYSLTQGLVTALGSRIARALD